MTAPILQSLIADRWVGGEAGVPLLSAVSGRLIHHTHAESLDFGEALQFARTKGLPALLAL
ncbi:MAG TPA: hypothetical protein VFG60_05990, partial [Burkholderiaceae bacterium]|nr:hypothetical protein [Burkholderiaceae bacterium]